MFTRIVVAAAIAGLVAGFGLTVFQQLTIEPLLRAAEVREAAAAAAMAPNASLVHGHDAWSPGTRVERFGATLLANITMTIGFGMMLAAAMMVRGHHGWRRGLLWGLVGFVVAFAAPACVLPPELPGIESAPLDIRTRLWLMVVATTAGGFALLAFAPRLWLRIVGAAIVASPHVIALWMTPVPRLVAIDEARNFIALTALGNALAWSVLGVVVGAVLSRNRS